jgi:hypothetical protein
MWGFRHTVPPRACTRTVPPSLPIADAILSSRSRRQATSATAASLAASRRAPVLEPGRDRAGRARLVAEVEVVGVGVVEVASPPEQPTNLTQWGQAACAKGSTLSRRRSSAFNAKRASAAIAIAQYSVAFFAPIESIASPTAIEGTARPA